MRPVLSVKAEVRTRRRSGRSPAASSRATAPDFSFRLFGRMLSRAVDVGATVQQGDELAAVDPRCSRSWCAMPRPRRPAPRAQLANAAAEEARQRPLAERNITPQATFDLVVQNRQTAAGNLVRAQASLRRAQDQLSSPACAPTSPASSPPPMSTRAGR